MQKSQTVLIVQNACHTYSLSGKNNHDLGTLSIRAFQVTAPNDKMA